MQKTDPENSHGFPGLMEYRIDQTESTHGESLFWACIIMHMPHMYISIIMQLLTEMIRIVTYPFPLIACIIALRRPAVKQGGAVS